jgi:hypothetical protein
MKEIQIKILIKIIYKVRIIQQKKNMFGIYLTMNSRCYRYSHWVVVTICVDS